MIDVLYRRDARAIVIDGRPYRRKSSMLNQGDLREMYLSVRKTYDRIMAVERSLTDEERQRFGQQWLNIMRSMLTLMLSTDADEAFLEDREKMQEYDSMLERYLGLKGPSHIDFGRVDK